jgi:DNA replication protein DnaC
MINKYEEEILGLEIEEFDKLILENKVKNLGMDMIDIMKKAGEITRNKIIKQQIGDYAFKNYTIDKIDKSILKKCLGYPTKSLYLYGAIGSGKTFTAIALARRFLYFIYKKTYNLSREIRMCKDVKNEIDLIDFYSNAKILVLDGLGTEIINEYYLKRLEEIFDERTRRIPGGLIITSDLCLKDIEKKYGERIALIILEICRLVELPARKIKAKGEK